MQKSTENANPKGRRYANLISKKQYCCALALAFASVMFLFRDATYVQKATTDVTKLLFQKANGDCTSSSNSKSPKAASFRSKEKWQKKILSPGLAAICSHFDKGQTTSSVWRLHQQEILEAASMLDERMVHRDWIKELWHLLSSNLHWMERGLRSTPSMATMENILTKVGELLLVHKSNNNNNGTLSDEYPPLQVVIVGGSVPEGAGCNMLPREIWPFLPDQKMGRFDNELKGQRCAFPARLQLLADAFLGPGIVQIHNLAMGGTNTLLSLPVLEYRLYPSQLALLRKQGPDIIVNAYAANDNLYSWDNSEKATADLTHLHKSLLRAKSFYQTALKSRQSCPPMVLFLEEYLGNQNEELLGEDIRNDAVQLLTDAVNDIGYISSAAVARHWVYAQTKETLFSPDWSRGPLKPDVHFGMAGHQHVAWVMAYSILQSVMEFCEDIDDGDAPIGHMTTSSGVGSTDAASSRTMYEPQTPSYLNCTTNLSVNSDTPCSFAFVATPAGTVKSAASLNQYIKPYQTSQGNGGWFGENNIRNGWQNKLGLVPRQTGASIGLSIPNLRDEVRVITIHYLMSYGEQWEHSEALFNFTVWSSEAILQHEVSFTLTGYHNESTSLTFPYTLDLGEKTANVGQSVGLNITLTNGTAFKITAIMMCSR
jgi:hypothetical protein